MQIEKSAISKNQDGIVHHIGLIIIGFAFIGLLGFAGIKVVQNQSQSNKAISADSEIANDHVNTPNDVTQTSSQDTNEEATNDL